MKRLFAMFVLTPREQRLVIFVVLALVIGVSIRHHRDLKVNEGLGHTPATLFALPLVSPTPNDS